MFSKYSVLGGAKTTLETVVEGLGRYTNYLAFATVVGTLAYYYLERATRRIYLGYSLNTLTSYLFLNS